MVYEERLLLFADILGWSAANSTESSELLLKVVRQLHSPAETYSEALKAQMQGAVGTLVHAELGPMKVSSVNPMYLDVQFGAFSGVHCFGFSSLCSGETSGILDCSSSRRGM